MQMTSEKRRLLTVALLLTGWTLVVILAVKLISLTTATTPDDVTYDAKTIYANSAGAVFYVRSLDAEEQLKTSGSGFAIEAGGLALTAAHVVKDAHFVHAVLPSGEELADVLTLYLDDKLDIAVLRLPQREQGYEFLTLEGRAPLSGETAYAIGYPLKTVKLVADGIVASPESNINETPRMLITNDLASGMSGGPVVCGAGTVIGIASATLRTMNGVSVSPTTAQIRDAVAPYVVKKTAFPDEVETPQEAEASIGNATDAETGPPMDADAETGNGSPADAGTETENPTGDTALQPREP